MVMGLLGRRSPAMCPACAVTRGSFRSVLSQSGRVDVPPTPGARCTGRRGFVRRRVTE